MDKKVHAHFKKADPVLAAIIDIFNDSSHELAPRKTTDYFSHLCDAIVSQQLSEKAGTTIWNRFVLLFPDKKVTPAGVLSLQDETIRAVGSSWSKISYLKNLARDVESGKLDLDTLSDLDDDAVIAELTKVKGIGPWTAEMFLMFALGRPDVFSFGDLGLRNAIKKLYKFKKDPTRKQMEKISKIWSPYRTYACRVLWKSLEL